MTIFKEKLLEINRLQQQIDATGQFSDEVRKLINYKFRLDWNYHSNSMEGNTLTLDETRSVMINNLTIEGKPLRDVIEMRGHDNVITQILSIGKGATRLSEKRIKEIHKAIVHEEEADKKELVGKWKSKPNYLYNYKGERFDFTAPELVPEQMHALINATNAALDAVFANKKDAEHPVTLAFRFHLEYVSIHPFHDGNGRTARILSNLILIACGYPPHIIDTKEKETYNRYLGDVQAYGGAPDLFYGFLADKLMRSQKLVLDAIAGKNINEPSDIDKEISLFVMEQTAAPLPEEIKVSSQIALQVYQQIVSPLFSLYEEKHRKLDSLFTENVYYRAANDGILSKEAIQDFDIGILELAGDTHNHNPIFNTSTIVRHHAYKNGGVNMFSIVCTLKVSFGEYQFVIRDEEEVFASFNYKKAIDITDIEGLIAKVMKKNLAAIKRLSSVE